MPTNPSGFQFGDISGSFNGLLQNFGNFSRTDASTHIYGATPSLVSSMRGGMDMNNILPIAVILGIILIFKK